MTIQIIEHNGEPEYAVVPYHEWQRLLELAEDAEDIRAGEQALRELESGEDELIPDEMVNRLLEGESPLRVWREHRGFTQAQLARRADTSQSAVAQIENRQRTGSIELLKKLAQALHVDLDDLAD